MKDKWNVHELHSMLVQEEMRLKNQGSHSVHYVSHQGNQGAGKKFMKKHDKGRGTFLEGLPKVQVLRLLTIQTISPNEKFVFMGNKVKAPTYYLKLDTGDHLDLLETLYVPSLSRNLVSLSKLDVTGYSFNFGNGYFSLIKHNHVIGTNVLCVECLNCHMDSFHH
ncbi:hypothetical protein GmHk_17G049837 [Glycine max]|nr:hypothetical protein GmHk_17G049837 [Glycine max]